MNKTSDTSTASISTSTSPNVYHGTSTSANSSYSFALSNRTPDSAQKHNAKKLEGAVYNYVRAIRALGRTQVSLSEIAKALGLSEEQVSSTLSALESKGIRSV